MLEKGQYISVDDIAAMPRQRGDVLNLGTVRANRLHIEGINVTVLSTDAVTDANGAALTGANVTIRSVWTPHIGYDVGNKIARNFDVNGTAMPHDVSDYAHPNTAASATSRGWDIASYNTGREHTDYDYMRVHDVYELQHIAAKMNGRYMLAGNIDAGVTNTWNRTSNGIEGFHPIGGGSSDAKFMGQFDGVGHTIEGLYIRHIDKNRIGLFGNANGSYIENVSLKNSHVTGQDQVGGIVGYALGGNIRNVSFSGMVDGSRQVGGILGAGRYFTIRSTYNAGTVSGDSDVGGFVGFSNHVPLWDVWNVGNVRATGRNIGGIAGHVQDSTIQNALHTGTVIRQGSGIEASVGGIVGNAESEKINHVVWKSGSVTQEGGAFTADAVGVSSFVRTTDVQECTDAQLKQTATYTDWKDEDDKAVVATEGGKGTPWRIYDGKTTPLLTGLMKGTKRLEKTYDGKTFGAGDAHIHTDSTAEKNIGEYDAQGIYSDPFGYDLIGSTYKVIPRVLTLGTVAAQSKTYDGNTSADASKFHAALVGVVSGDENLVSVTATGAAYNSKDVASANAVNYTGVALGGTGAGNYRIASTVQGAGSITPKQLNLALTGGARFDKTYDGTANVTQSLTKDRNYTLTNFVNGEGEGITITGAGTYTDKNAGTGKTVTFGGLTLTGEGAGNYSLSTTTLTTTGDIAKRALTLEGTAGTQFTKTYDGNATVTQNLVRGTNYRLAGVVEGEGTNVVALNESAAQGAYTTANAQAAGAQQNVTFTNLALTGSGTGNYTLATSKTFENAGRITPKELNLALANGTRFDKTYDGNANVTQTLAKGMNYSLTGFITGEGTDIELNAVTGKYADKNAARDKAVTFGRLTLKGTGAGNYVLNSPTLTGTGTIARRALTLGAVAAQSKTYDGTTAADASQFHATLGNLVAGEENLVAATAAGASYNDKNVAGANAVGYTGVSLTGTGAGNYAVADTAQGTGTITQRALTLGTVAAQTKTYDGTRAADASKFRAALNNAVAGDSVTATAAGAAYNDKNVARANAVSYTGIALTGTGAGNYSIADTAQGAGTITRRALTLGTVTAQTKTYDGTTDADASQFRAALNNAVAGDNVTAAAAGATYNDHNVAAARTIDYTGVSLGGSDAGNYSLAATAAQGEGRITPKELNLALTGGARFDKTYDGTANVAQSLTKGTNYNLNGFVTGEGTDIELSAVTGKYADKNAAADKAVTFDGLTLTGTGAGNYTLDKNALTGIGTIAPRTLTLGTVAGQTKTYDGNTLADASKFGAVLNNVVAGDSVTATATGAAYNSKNVAAAHRIDYTGVALAGADAGNYTLAATAAQGTGTIAHRDLTLTADARSIVQGEALPSFTGRADGFADGEDASVFGPGGITFGTSAANTNTPGGYGIIGRVGGVSDGVFGNYRIGQAAGNATALTIHAAALPGGLLASLVQDAAPRFDMGFGQEVYVFGLPRPIPTATLGIYRFDAERAFEIQGLRL